VKFTRQLVNLIINNVPFYVFRNFTPAAVANKSRSRIFFPPFYWSYPPAGLNVKGKAVYCFIALSVLCKNLEEDLRTTKHKSVICRAGGKFARRGMSSFFINNTSNAFHYRLYQPSAMAICSGKHHETLRE
jgi:hypothetical protein